MRRFVLLLAILLIAGAAGCRSVPPPASIPDLSGLKPAPAPPTVFYIPGFRFQQGKNQIPTVMARRAREMKLLKEVFPGSAILYIQWENAVSWSRCVENANTLIVELQEKLLALPPAVRENIIIIGHSLGARIAVRVMAWLRRHNCRIGQGIFLGAAISDDDPDIAEAVKASRATAVNSFGPEDGILRFLLGTIGGRGAFGAYGSALPFPGLAQLKIDPHYYGDEWFSNHWGVLYLEHLPRALEEARRRKCRPVPEISIPLARMNYAPDAAESFLWHDLAHSGGWRFQQKRFFPFNCRIIDPHDIVRATGAEPPLRRIWRRISDRKL